MKLAIYIVDSFTDTAFKGNPAGVVMLTELIDEAIMRKIAKEINLSETAFVYQTSIPSMYQVRYFTPNDEIDFCGHATLALSWILGTKYQETKNKDGIQLETKVGLIPITWVMRHDTLHQVSMKQVSPQVRDFNGDIDELLDILGIHEEKLNPNYLIKLAYTGNWDLIVPILSKETINQIKPDMKRLKTYQLNHEKSSTHLFTFDGHRLYTRNFAPGVGIDEDPVTGSTNGALVGYLLLEKIVPMKDITLDIIQTNFLNREGNLNVSAKVSQDHIEINMMGKAVPVFSGTIHINEEDV